MYSFADVWEYACERVGTSGMILGEKHPQLPA